MTMHNPLAPGLDASQSRASHLITRLWARAADWIETAADYYAAAAMYEQLSKLSDAELQRRGLSRATLASDVCDTGRPVTQR
jgi:hypothetical protein